MSNNRVGSSTPPPTTSTVGTEVKPEKPAQGTAFTRKAQVVEPELHQQGLESRATRAVKINERSSVSLTPLQALKVSLLRLGAALFSGTRASHWLGDMAVQLMSSALQLGERSVAIKVQNMIEEQLIQLDEIQTSSYQQICSSFANEDQPVDIWGGEGQPSVMTGSKLMFDEIDESDDIEKSKEPEMASEPENDKFKSIADLDKELKSNPPVNKDTPQPVASPPPPSSARVTQKTDEPIPSDLSFLGRMNTLYDRDRSQEALAEMEQELFDGASHKLLENPIEKMAKNEEMSEEDIASLFNDIVHDVVTEEAATPVDYERLEQLGIMMQSMRRLYPQACDYKKSIDIIHEKLWS